MMLGINFIGLSYLLVYVGAVSILFLFILMLINIRISELLTETNNSIPLAVIVAIAFNYPVNEILPLSVDLKNSFINLIYNDNYYDSFKKFFNFFSDNSEKAFVTSNL